MLGYSHVATKTEQRDFQDLFIAIRIKKAIEMRIAAIDYQIRVPDVSLFLRAKEWGIAALELTRGTLMPERRWLSQPEGPAQLSAAAAAHGVTIASVSATFAYEWAPVDRRGRPDSGVIEALTDLAEHSSATGAHLLHIPCLEAPPPKTAQDQERYLKFFEPLLERAQLRGLVVSLETFWPADLARALADRSSPALCLSYDPGNALAAGRDPIAELALLGSRLGQLRLRERRKKAPFLSVPLGQGEINWSEIVAQLMKYQQDPDVVIASTGGEALVESFATAQQLFMDISKGLPKAA